MKSYKFNNGLTLLHWENKHSKSVSFSVTINVGIVHEDESVLGVSHFLEHTTFKGTKSRTHFQIVKEFDSLGISYNAYTDVDVTSYYFKALVSNLDKATEILSDIFFNSTYPQDEIEKERAVILEEYFDAFDDPAFLCMKNLDSAVYPKVLGRDVIGTEDTIKKIQRDDIIKHKTAFYTADNTVISIAGGISFQEAKALVEKYFLKFTDNKSKKNNLTEKYIARHVFQNKDVQQAQVNIAFELGNKLDRRIMLYNAIISLIFSGQMSSRLFQNIRDKLGLCYSIYGGSVYIVNNSMYVINFSTSYDKVSDATKAVRSEIIKFVNNGIDESELMMAKEQYKSKMVFAEESNQSRSSIMTTQYIRFGNLLSVDEKIKEVDSVTVSDINSYIKKMFDFNKVSSSLLCNGEDINLREIMLGENG